MSNIDNTTNIPGYCTGCEAHCKYGYKRTSDGKVIPTIAGEEHEYYIRPGGIIVPATVSSPMYAQQIAHLIAQTCAKYRQ